MAIGKDVRPIDATRLKKSIAEMAVKYSYSPAKARALLKAVDAEPTLSLVPQQGTPDEDGTSEIRLDPCKFCGARAAIFLADSVVLVDRPSVAPGHYVGCIQCGARTAAFADIGRAARAWNRVP